MEFVMIVKTESEKTISANKNLNPSRIRDHLANLRTYLAWMRTAVSLIGFGVVILRLRVFYPPQFPHSGIGRKIGLLFALVGLFAVLLSTFQYFSVLRGIETNTYHPSISWVILFSFAVGFLGTGIIYLIYNDPFHLDHFTAIN